MKLRKGKTGKDGEVQYNFICPGCDEWHGCKVPGWTFNDNIEKPTFSPSLLTTYRGSDKDRRCHCYIKDGMIQFLNDCTHKLAGKTVDMPDIVDEIE